MAQSPRVPSPLYSGERVRVRGGSASDVIHAICLAGLLRERPLTPALSPATGEREQERYRTPMMISIVN